MKFDISEPSTRFRSKVERGLSAADKIDTTGGDYGAGVIPGFSVISKGEALGHGLWIDSTFLQQTADAINATGNDGNKSRFTHPDMSGDGLGSMLGHAKNAKVVGDQVVADLHLLQSAHQTPDGNLAAYVMQLAKDAPKDFGASIAFSRDSKSETEFALENGATVSEGGRVNTGAFKSPDKGNAKNLWHARLGALHATDIVDEPAANPKGLFSRTPFPAEADALLSYALGLSKDRPTLTAFDIDPDRAVGFLARWMDRNGISLSKPAKEQPMSETTPVPQQPSEAELLAKFQAKLGEFTAKFGAENGAKWFGEGKTFEQGLELHCAALQAQLNAKDEEIAALQQQVAAAKLGRGEEPVKTGVDNDKKPTGLGIKKPGAN